MGTGVVIAEDELQRLFPYIPLASYPAASLSMSFFISEEAGEAGCLLAFLSGKCKVVVKCRASWGGKPCFSTLVPLRSGRQTVVEGGLLVGKPDEHVLLMLRVILPDEVPDHC